MHNISAFLGVTESIDSSKYLGLPSIIGKRNKVVFSFRKDRLWNRINHRTSKHLSKASKEIFVKFVAQSIPVYCMSVYLLLSSIQDGLQKMMNSFWWGSNKQQRKDINWFNWDKMTMKKEFGDLDFKHLHASNLATLGKQGWRMMIKHDTKVAKVFKAKYFPSADFLDAQLVHNPSFIWCSIHVSWVVVKEGLQWRIALEMTIQFKHGINLGSKLVPIFLYPFFMIWISR